MDIRPPKVIAEAYDMHPAEPLRVKQPDRIPDPYGSEPITVKQPDRMPDPHAPIVTLYVRKGDHARERIISVNPIPDGIDQIELLRLGFALDGNSATIPVDPYTFAYDADVEEGKVEGIQRWTPGGLLPGDWATTWSLTKAVNCIEHLLVNWVTRRLGYQVKFG
jgi:hypothetical protein